MSDSLLVGRERELARLIGLAEVARAGIGQIVVLSGEAGIGKSHLGAEVLARCVGLGFAVFSGAADEVEQRRPFGVIVDALAVLDGRGGTRTEIVGLLGGAGGLGVEARISDLLDRLAGEACGAGPVVILLDDLQWADESSLAAIARIARSAASRPLLLLCALRPYPAGRVLRALLASLDYRRALRLTLEGLPADEVAELARRLGDAPPGPSLLRALAQTGGNPFYVTELVARLLQEGAASISERHLLEVTLEGLPPSLRLTVLEGLRSLPEPTLDVLRAAAVVGRSFSVADVALISPSAVGDVAAALRPAERAGLVVAEGERLAFRHDLIREAIYDELTPAVRKSLQRELASRLSEAGASPDRVAAQLMPSADPGDAEAIRWLRLAGSDAAASPAIAAELLGRALELAGEGTPLRRALLADLVRPLLWSAQSARVEEVCVEGLAAGPAAGDEPLFWLGLANARLLQGRFEEARQTCREAPASVRLDDLDRLGLAGIEALCGVFLGDPRGVELARRIIATAPPSGPAATAHEAIGQWELFAGRADRAVAAYEQAEPLRARPVPESRIWQGSRARVRMWHALALLDLDRLDEAARLLEQDLAAEIAVPAIPHAFLAAVRYHAGLFEEAVTECRAAIASAEAAHTFLPAAAPALAAMVALRRGQAEEAERLSAQAERVRTPAEPGGDRIAQWTRILLLEARGEADAAADAAAETLSTYLRAGFPAPLAWYAPDLVRVALRAGRPQQATRAADAAEQAARQLPVASRRAGALRARGLLSDDSSLLLQAVAAARAAPRPVDLALSLRDAAAALARAGEREAARPLALEALDLLSGLGAAGDERRARALLRASGLTVGAHTKHRGAEYGWGSLTEAELRVVRLLADGRSNPEMAKRLYLSRRTVGWHLSNVYRKLGLSSRVELVAEALRRGLL